MQRVVVIFAGILCVSSAALIAGRFGGAAGNGDVEAGRTIYVKKCQTCHGKKGEGNQKLAKTLKVEIKDLGTPEVQSKSDEELRKNTVEGIGKMKPVKDLSKDDTVNVIAFVRSLKKEKAAP